VQWGFVGADTSYGRQYDGDANWIQFLVSTPDASNGINPNGVDSPKNTEIQLYPNPAIHEIYLNEKNNVRVYNQQGKLIYQKAQINKISVADWPNGQYILTTDQGKSIKFEIIH
jgi:hypothetical protein